VEVAGKEDEAKLELADGERRQESGREDDRQLA
jgi:hypothetical protein